MHRRAAQAGDANHLAAPAVERSFSVNKIASSVVVTSDRATASPGQAVKLTATVVIAKGQPTGTVTFMDGSTTLGTVPLGAGGKATLSITTLAIGMHDISAVFAETATIAGSTGVLPGGVTVSLAASTVTVANARDLEKKSSRVGQAYVVKVQVAARRWRDREADGHDHHLRRNGVVLGGPGSQRHQFVLADTDDGRGIHDHRHVRR